MLHAPPQTAKEALIDTIERDKISKALGNARAIQALRKAVPAFKRGDYKSAAVAAAEAADADAKSAIAYHLLALSLDNLGERHKAFQMYERALALDPNDPDLYLNIGTAASQLRLFDGAIKAFRTYIALRPNCPKGFNNLAGALRDKGEIAVGKAAGVVHWNVESQERHTSRWV